MKSINDKVKSINIMPSYFGSFVLSHSKSLMNKVNKQIDGFYNNCIYYSVTDFQYLHKKMGLTRLRKDSMVW